MSLMFCLLVGSLFVVRTNKILRILGYMSPMNGRIVMIAALAVTILASWMSRAPQFVLWTFALALFLSPKIVLSVVQRRRRRQFHNETSRFYDRMLLGVRSGVAAREVLRRISQDAGFGFHTRDLADASLREDAALFETRDAEFRQRAEDLRRILSAGQRTADRLQSLRRSARMRERFQRKSRNATQPVRAQIGVILSLYIGLLAYQTSQDPEVMTSAWLLGSATLVFFGLYVIFRQQRSFKWSI
ncbi:MAG: type II secretion system F family protein [Bdellovibrionaceae bacterium]|nr:type II secretion system F family protein [Pseudobdellovibrionaceae bacterium]